MNVLLDTSVWSLALRRRAPEETPIVHAVRELILESRARIMGRPIYQPQLVGGVPPPAVPNVKLFSKTQKS